MVGERVGDPVNSGGQHSVAVVQESSAYSRIIPTTVAPQYQ
jgi:hypothetical protein